MIKHNAGFYEEKIREIWDSIVPDLVEEQFPKGECEERGRAILLVALIYIKVLPKLNAFYKPVIDKGKLIKEINPLNSEIVHYTRNAVRNLAKAIAQKAEEIVKYDGMKQ